MEDTNQPKIGAHISSSGSLENTLQRAQEIGAECMQIFAGSPRRYNVKKIDKESINKYLKILKKLKSFPVFIHANYLVNLASEENTIKEKSSSSIKELLFLSEKIKSVGVIYHPGSPKKGDKKKAIEREIISLKNILAETPPASNIIIENTAGIKKIGTNEDEIGYIIKKLKSPRVKVCLDTAHALESGNIKNFSLEEIKKWLAKWHKKINLERVVAFHINDSLTAPGSHHDRHANIGEGFIGKNGFVNLISLKKIKKIPWIIEVPGFEKKGPDKKNIDILKKIRKNTSKNN